MRYLRRLLTFTASVTAASRPQDLAFDLVGPIDTDA